MRKMFLIIPGVMGLENGVARTPPMGFISWQRFESDTDCTHHPGTCISETLYLEIAEAMEQNGLVEAGYVYVNIDDNWSERTSNKEADHSRFSHGMAKLSEDIRKLGMKFGMYSDIGTKTCQGYTGLDMDDDSRLESVVAFIDQLIEWRVEYLKVDGCFAQVGNFRTTYPKLSHLIQWRIREKNQQLREKNMSSEKKEEEYEPILLSCSWPAYEPDNGVNELDLALLRKYCNTWRNYGDIRDSSSVMKSIVDWYASKSTKSDDLLVSAAGPGHWNDPDMLLIGNNGLSIALEKTQFNLWAIMAAPLYISADVRKMGPNSLAILKNEKVIAVNQDKLGRQGWVIDVVEKFIRVWMRPLSQDSEKRDRVAVLFESLWEEGNVRDYELSMEKLGWAGFKSWSAVDCYSDKVIQGTERDTVFRVTLDENTSQMYIFTKDGGATPDYPIHQFRIPKASKVSLNSLNKWLKSQHLTP